MEFRIQDVLGAMPLNEDVFSSMDEKDREEYFSKAQVQKREAVHQSVVFGHDHKTVNGEPVEQGIGSKNQPSANSVASYARYCREEPDFEKNLARMRKELADYQASRRPATAR